MFYFPHPRHGVGQSSLSLPATLPVTHERHDSHSRRGSTIGRGDLGLSYDCSSLLVQRGAAFLALRFTKQGIISAATERCDLRAGNIAMHVDEEPVLELGPD